MISSLNRLINDRVASPLYSTFIVSWILCNWKIFYVTMFVEAGIIYPHNKVEYILQNYLNIWPNLLFPLASTGALLFAVPYAETFVYKRYLNFRTDRRKLKEAAESERRLSVEESRELAKEQILLTEDYERQVAKKQRDIEGYRKLIEDNRHYNTDLKVHYAGYGVYPDLRDVTEDVRKAIRDNNLKFFVSNNAFSTSDPAPTILKDFCLVFERNGITWTQFLKENTSVVIDDRKASFTFDNNTKSIFLTNLVDLDKFKE